MREYFCAYHSMLNAIEPLTDTECGRLFRGLLQYSQGQQPTAITGRESLLFGVFKQNIDREVSKYAAVCERNRKNQKGTRKQANNQNNESLPVVNLDNQNNEWLQEEEKEEEKDKDKDEEEHEEKGAKAPPSSASPPRGDERPKKPRGGGVMKRPTVEEVAAYVAEKGYHFDPAAFVAFYASKGWMVGKSPMKDWHMACVTWENRSKPVVKPVATDPWRALAAKYTEEGL